MNAAFYLRQRPGVAAAPSNAAPSRWYFCLRQRPPYVRVDMEAWLGRRVRKVCPPTRSRAVSLRFSELWPCFYRTGAIFKPLRGGCGANAGAFWGGDQLVSYESKPGISPG